MGQEFGIELCVMAAGHLPGPVLKHPPWAFLGRLETPSVGGSGPVLKHPPWAVLGLPPWAVLGPVATCV